MSTPLANPRRTRIDAWPRPRPAAGDTRPARPGERSADRRTRTPENRRRR